jgi:nuclear pore complex protein Nup98-Nup96
MTVIVDSEGAPFATLPERFSFSDFFDGPNARNPVVAHEKLVWQLASVLFDEIVVPDELQQVANAVDRLRKDKLSDFWQRLVDQASTQQVAMARSSEEKAIAALSGHRVSDACGHLLNGKDFH